jgi:molybdopterin molybdotransferase
VLPLDEARRTILQHVSPLEPEAVPLLESAGRILAAPQVAPRDMPQWDNSAMDGYAVRVQDCADGQPLTVEGILSAGHGAVADLAPGTARRIMTGAPLPAGADAVVPFEHTEAVGSSVRVLVRPVRGDYVRYRAGDLRAGDQFLETGTVLGPAEIAILASLDRSPIAVVRRPVVAILSTGDELHGAGEPLRPGGIYDSNGPAIAAAVARTGAIPSMLPLARDEPEILRQRIVEGLSADVLVTSAGVSVGDRDLVREVLSGLGARELFWRVAIQPGRPMAFAVTDRCKVFSLPGNPVSALLAYEVLVRPALRRMMGHCHPVEPTRRAQLGDDVQPRPDRITLRRVCLAAIGEGSVAISAGNQETGLVRTLARADGVVLIPAGDDVLPAGTSVDVIPLRSGSL